MPLKPWRVVIGGFLCVTPFASAEPVPETCDLASLGNTKTQLSEHLKNPSDGWSVLDALAKGKKVLLVGENHQDAAPYKEIMERYLSKDGAVFLEVADKFQGKVDSYLKGELELDKLLDVAKSVNGFEAVFETAKKLGVPVYCVDIESTDLSDRSKAMAKGIKSKVDAGTIKSLAILFVGNGHLKDITYVKRGRENEIRPSIQAHLVEAGIDKKHMAHANLSLGGFFKEITSSRPLTGKDLWTLDVTKMDGKGFLLRDPNYQNVDDLGILDQCFPLLSPSVSQAGIIFQKFAAPMKEPGPQAYGDESAQTSPDSAPAIAPAMHRAD